MAQESSIRVFVLEAAYTRLQAVGIPMPLCMHMQELGMNMSDALWTSRQTKSGFSVPFFWPTCTSSVPWYPPLYPTGAGFIPPKKRRRRRRKRYTSKKSVVPNVNTQGPVHKQSGKENTSTALETPPRAYCDPSQTSLAVDTPLTDHSLDTITTKRVTLEPRPSQSSQVVSDVIATPTEPSFSHVPSFDHHSLRTRTDESETSELVRSDEDEISELDLNSCEQVVYEVRDVPGVSYVNDGELGWTPVKKKRPRKKAEAADVSVSSESDSNDLCFPGCNISYKSRSGYPGLLVQGKSKIWTPIAARTRKKKKEKKI